MRSLSGHSLGVAVSWPSFMPSVRPKKRGLLTAKSRQGPELSSWCGARGGTRTKPYGERQRHATPKNKGGENALSLKLPVPSLASARGLRECQACQGAGQFRSRLGRYESARWDWGSANAAAAELQNCMTSVLLVSGAIRMYPSRVLLMVALGV